MYYKDHLPLIRRGDLFTLQENVETKIKSRGKSISLHVFLYPQVKIKLNLNYFTTILTFTRPFREIFSTCVT